MKRKKFSSEQIHFLEGLINAPTYEIYCSDGKCEKILVEHNKKDLLLQCLRECFYDDDKFWPLLENAHKLVQKSKLDDYELSDLYRYTHIDVYSI